MYYTLLDFSELLEFGSFMSLKCPYAKSLVASYTNPIGGGVAQDVGAGEGS